jgi:hypothetical protein
MRIHSPQITGSAANTNIVLTTITSSISVLSSSFADTASYWSGSIINAASASYWSGSIINAATASYILNAQSASYVLNAVSASYAATSSFADNLTVAGTLTAQTINVQTITSSIDYVTGSSINGSLLSNTHQITGSTSITGSLTVNNSNVILANQTSSMSVATASYWSGSIINAESASYALTASYAANVPETASYALQANSASFALTASYISGSGGGVGFPFSGSAIVTGSLYVSGSTISGSFVGDGSGITGLTAGGKIHTQSSAASTWTVTHNLGVQYPNVTVYNASNEVIIPQTITATDANTLTLTFGSAVAGYAVSGIGGIINVQGRTTQQYFTAATTWSFAHNLGDRYVSLQAFDDAFEMMIPTTIRLVDATSSIMLFDSASSGYAVATIGGDLPAISSSYAGYTLQVANSAPYSASWVAVPNVTVTTAQTASYANNFTVGGTLTAQTINVQTITSSIEYVTGSTRNGSIAGNTHQFTGSILVSTSTQGRIITTNQTATTGYFYSGQKNGTEIAYWYYDDSSIQFSSVSGSRSLNFYTTDTERMRIEAAGSAVFSANVFVRANDRGYSVQHSDGTYNGGLGNLNGSNLKTGYFYLNQNGSTTIQLHANGISYINGGNLSIGTTSDNGYKLNVNGSIYGNSFITINGQINNLGTGTGTYTQTVWYNDTGNQILFENARITDSASGTGRTVYFTWRGGPSVGGGVQLQHGANAWAAYTSDARMKTKVADVTNGLETINKLNPIKFKWTRELENSRTVTGFTAQNVGEAIPDAVFDSWHDDELGDVKSYYQDYLVPYLVKSIQELSAKNTQLEEILQRNNIQ